MARIGIYNLRLQARGGGERKTAAMAEHFSKNHEVLLITHTPVDLVEYGEYFNTDLSRVNQVALPTLKINRIANKKSSRSILDTVQAAARYGQLKALKLDVFINNSVEDTTPNPCDHGIYMCMFPSPPDYGPGDPLRRGVWRLRKTITGSIDSRIATYNVVTANSAYTSGWIKKWWNSPSVVIYSAPQDMGPPGAKDKVILSVGRFSALGGENHPKRQELMVETFREMSDLHTLGWTLHLAGSTERTPEGEQFLADLRANASGFPVEIHCNASIDELRDLYRRASIYWHATGYGWPEDQYPKRQEHLGLAPLEAMSAGAVPIVINSGGLKETVDHGRSGYRWNTLEELQDFTRRLAADPDALDGFSKEALSSLSRFSKDAFMARMDTIVNSLLSGTPVDQTIL